VKHAEVAKRVDSRSNTRKVIGHEGHLTAEASREGSRRSSGTPLPDPQTGFPQMPRTIPSPKPLEIVVPLTERQKKYAEGGRGHEFVSGGQTHPEFNFYR